MITTENQVSLWKYRQLLIKHYLEVDILINKYNLSSDNIENKRRIKWY